MSRTKRWALRSALGAGLLAASFAPAAAQSVLLVRVTAESGVPLADATVAVSQLGQTQRRLPTDARGTARFAAVLPGLYDIRIELLGHRPHIEEGVAITLGDTRVVEITLVAAPIELQGLTVNSERVRIERENTDFMAGVDEEAIALLPVTHNARDLVAFTPGARADHVWGGATIQANNYRIDGLSANHPGLGGDLIQPNINWISRVDVRGLGSGAEYGGFQGGLVDITTKRGDADFRGMIRTSFENEALNASNLSSTETAGEVAGRREIEGEVRGPLVKDRLFYYASAKGIWQDRFNLNHLAQIAGSRAPELEGRTDAQLFGKLTWTPRAASEVNLSGAYLGATVDNYGQTGYQAPGASLRYEAPSWLLTGTWRETLGTNAVLEARVNHFRQDERQDPYGGSEVPAVQIYALSPPYRTFLNNPLTLASSASSTSAGVSGSFRVSTGELDHVVTVGADYTRGHYVNERTRNGGMTWLPADLGDFDPVAPATWFATDWYTGTERWIASRWGGDVHLDSKVANTAAYAQSSLSLGERVVLSPGLRWSRWQGWLTPIQGERFQAVTDQAVDLRVGLAVDLTEDGTFAAKAHWGRYHQDLVSQMFDRAAGSDAFTNEEIWYYRGDAFTDPGRVFTEEERNALAAQGLFTRESAITLNETGPVDGYRQPYMDQWLVGLEKRAGKWVKLELVYAQRRNHDMVALVDRNRETNHTRFTGLRTGGGSISDRSRAGVGPTEVLLPNNVLLERLRCLADQTCPGLPGVPGMTLDDSTSLRWDPDYVLTVAPDAQRRFDQVQATVEVARPTWGGSFSFVHTTLEGNLDNVTGYTDPAGYGAGQYVHVNQAANAYGNLENSADWEAKISAWGDLPQGIRGGLFWTYRSGDHYSRRFRLTGLGLYGYGVRTDEWMNGPLGNPYKGDYVYERLDYHYFVPLEGQDVFVDERGSVEMRPLSNVDLHLERTVGLGGREATLAADVFNVLGSGAITDVQQIDNFGTNPWGVIWHKQSADLYYKAPLERQQPRTLRLSLAVSF